MAAVCKILTTSNCTLHIDYNLYLEMIGVQGENTMLKAHAPPPPLHTVMAALAATTC
jgi:hypothetical protein